MNIDEYARRLRWQAECCPSRDRCPLAFLCATRSKDGKYLLPTITEASYGEMVWTDLAVRQRILVVRSGLFLSKVYANDGEENPQGMFAPGFLTGLTEMYGPFVASNFYFLSCLVPGALCSFDGDFVKERIEELPPAAGQTLAARALLNQTTAIYGQTLTMAHRKAREKVVSALMRLDHVLSWDADFDGNIPVTHGDIASIALMERATASRELQKLAAEGFVSLGRRSLRVLPPMREAYDYLIETKLPFYPPAPLP